MAENKISELPAIQCPKLEYLDLSENKIDKFDSWAGHPTLRTLLLSNNKLKSMAFCQNLPELRHLSVSENSIPALAGYDGLTSLETLDLGKTKIDKIEEELPELPALKSIDLSETRISNLDNLKPLFAFESLRDLDISQTPLEVNASSFNFLLAEILIAFPKLTGYCGRPVAEKNRYEALYTARYRWEKETERKRKEAEEQRLKEEAEAAEEE